MNNRRKQIAQWSVKNIEKWPEPFNTKPYCADPNEIGAKWMFDQTVSSLPFLACNLGAGYVTSVDWFYLKKSEL